MEVQMARRPRPKIRYTPQWEGPIAGFTVNAIRRVFPSLASRYEFEDLLQEARIKFFMCCRAYQGKVDNPAWFMSLYKRALVNHLNTLTERNARYNFLDYNDPSHIPDAGTTGGEGELMEVLQVIANLPAEFSGVMTALVTGQTKGVSKSQVGALQHRLQKELQG